MLMFDIFVPKMTAMRYLKRIFGLPLVCIGVLTLVLPFLFGHSNNNISNIAGLLMIIAGIILYVRAIRRESDY